MHQVVLRRLDCFLWEEGKPKSESAVISLCDTPQIKIFSLTKCLPLLMPRPKNSRMQTLDNRDHPELLFPQLSGYVSDLGNLFHFFFKVIKSVRKKLLPISPLVLFINFTNISLVVVPFGS